MFFVETPQLPVETMSFGRILFKSSTARLRIQRERSDFAETSASSVEPLSRVVERSPESVLDRNKRL
jgi:hypothetical protein